MHKILFETKEFVNSQIILNDDGQVLMISVSFGKEKVVGEFTYSKTWKYNGAIFSHKQAAIIAQFLEFHGS